MKFRVGECFLIVLLMSGGLCFHTLWTEGLVPVKLLDIDDVFLREQGLLHRSS